jgi:hypothetical protein
MRKLSKPMEDMVKGAEIHEVRVNGEVVRRGYIVAGKTNTIIALLDRGICTPAMSAMEGNYSFHWLTRDGMEVWSELTGKSASLAIVECAAARHYANATSDDAEISFYQGTAYMSSKQALMDAAEMAFPDITVDEFYALFCESYSPGDLADIVDIFRANRATEDHSMPSDMITAADIIDGSEAAEARMSARLADVLAANPYPAQVTVKPWLVLATDNEDYDTHELPGDAERIWDAENAALEGDSITAELEAERLAQETEDRAAFDAETAAQDELIRQGAEMDRRAERRDPLSEPDHDPMMLLPRVITDNDAMIWTGRTYVSKAYLNTMRRIGGESRDSIMAWRSRQYDSRLTMVDDFHVLDMMVDEGTMPFGKADRRKRIIRNMCRPHIGAKRKPSKNRR